MNKILVKNIKELLRETDIYGNDDFFDFAKISLNASTVLSFIYENDKLKSFFEEKVNIYNTLLNDNDEYQKTLNSFKNNLLELTKENISYISDFLPIIFADENLKWKYYPCKKEDAYKLYCQQERKAYYILDTIINAFTTFTTNLNNTKFNKPKTIYNLLLFSNIAKNKTKEIDYHINLKKTFEYYFLSKYANLDFFDENYYDFNICFYLFLAYRKILQDILQFATEINLTDEQKKELENYKMTTTEQTVYNLLLKNPNYTDKDIANKLYIEPSTVRTHIQHICQKMNVKNKTELTNKIKNHQI